MSIKQIGEDIAVIKTKIETVEENIDQIKKKILGNGENGLCIRVDRLEQNTMNIDKRKETGWKRIVGIATVISIVFAIISYLLNRLNI